MVVDLSLPGVSTIDILAFMECLAQSGMSPDHITNHITASRSMCIVCGVDTLTFRDQRIPLFIKSLNLNRSFTPRMSLLIDETLLLQIVTASAQLQFPEVYRPLYLMEFFSFLRLSNILPHTVNMFDKTRHLCVGGVILSKSRAVTVIKWSKTFQDCVKTTTLDIVSLHASALCAVTALLEMLNKIPSNVDSPLFRYHMAPDTGLLLPQPPGNTLKVFQLCWGCP